MAESRDCTPVVTAFLYSGDRIALIRRSNRVGTYQGLWAAFSGYVERLPLNQAYQELSEEAGLTEIDVRLAGIGIPLVVDDKKVGTCWLVFPFLFELEDSIQIQANWEASELAWYLPEEIRNLETVPGLERALTRVWPPFGDRPFWHGLSKVARDTERGATELARIGLATLGGLVQAHWEQMSHVELLRAIRAFASCRPSMGVFPDLAARLLLAIDREAGQFNFDELVTELLSAVNDATKLSTVHAAHRLAHARKLFTLSYSEAVRDTIINWHTKGSEVIVAESNPRKEGIRLAEELASKDVKVRVVPDSEIPFAVEESDAIIVGCDAITPSDRLMNKSGTYQAVRRAQTVGVATYAVAQTYKIVPPDWPEFIEIQSTLDYESESKENIQTFQIFDVTPLSDFTEILTEEGNLTQENLSEIRSELASVELIPAES
jgi:translation initiation factor 2B subunit (eIF-2B alpha/beta/delta family)